MPYPDEPQRRPPRCEVHQPVRDSEAALAETLNFRRAGMVKTSGLSRTKTPRSASLRQQGRNKKKRGEILPTDIITIHSGLAIAASP